MNRVEEALRAAADDLSRSGRRWALVGGFAVSARSEPRFTRDVDIAVAVDDDAGAEELVRGLMGSGYHLFSTLEHDNGRLATARMSRTLDGVDVIVDLLFASSGIEPEIAAAAEVLEILPGLRLPVATVGHLITLKLLARDDDTRPQDLADLRALIAASQPPDILAAEEAIDLVLARGYNRGRDLRTSLRELAG